MYERKANLAISCGSVKTTFSASLYLTTQEKTSWNEDNKKQSLDFLQPIFKKCSPFNPFSLPPPLSDVSNMVVKLFDELNDRMHVLRFFIKKYLLHPYAVLHLEMHSGHSRSVLWQIHPEPVKIANITFKLMLCSFCNQFIARFINPKS